jgi:hypothetical protein
VTRNELAKGSAVFLAVAAAGFLSVRSVDPHDAIDPPYVAADAKKTPSTSGTPCVGEDGSWKNWVWANVPMLSPKCPPGQK